MTQFDCHRRADFVGWLAPDGTFTGARCGSTNKCEFCGWLYAMETAAAVYLDAERHGFPRLALTLTTKAPSTEPAELRRGVEKVTRALRRRYGPDVAYLAFVEWTTGSGKRSGGHRRVHMHLLVKGLHPEEAAVRDRHGETAEDMVRRIWDARTGAHRVQLEELRSPWAASRYLTHHHNKPGQRPPEELQKGFKRLRPSKNYFAERLSPHVDEFGREREGLRAETRRILADDKLRAAARALVHEAYDDAPDEVWAQEFRACLDAERDRREAERPQLVRKVQTRWDDVGVRTSYEPGGYGSRKAEQDALRRQRSADPGKRPNARPAVGLRQRDKDLLREVGQLAPVAGAQGVLLTLGVPDQVNDRLASVLAGLGHGDAVAGGDDVAEVVQGGDGDHARDVGGSGGGRESGWTPVVG